MIKIGYNSTPVVQITLSGDVTATLLAETLTITTDNDKVYLDDTTTQLEVNPSTVRSVEGQRFSKPSNLALYLENLKLTSKNPSTF